MDLFHIQVASSLNVSVVMGTPSRGRGRPQGSGPKQLAARSLLPDTSQFDPQSQLTVCNYGEIIACFLALWIIYSYFTCFMEFLYF